MDFITIGQYINRLQIVYFLLLIMPLLAFLGLHFDIVDHAPPPDRRYAAVLSVAVALVWLLATVTFNKRIKSARNAQGLGAKLAKYFHITIVRYSLISLAGLLLALAYFLGRNEVFTGFFLLHLVVAGWLRPSGPRVASELCLKGAEYEMVHFRRDNL